MNLAKLLVIMFILLCFGILSYGLVSLPFPYNVIFDGLAGLIVGSSLFFCLLKEG